MATRALFVCDLCKGEQRKGNASQFEAFTVWVRGEFGAKGEYDKYASYQAYLEVCHPCAVSKGWLVPGKDRAMMPEGLDKIDPETSAERFGKALLTFLEENVEFNYR